MNKCVLRFFLKFSSDLLIYWPTFLKFSSNLLFHWPTFSDRGQLHKSMCIWFRLSQGSHRTIKPLKVLKFEQESADCQPLGLGSSLLKYYRSSKKRNRNHSWTNWGNDEVYWKLGINVHLKSVKFYWFIDPPIHLYQMWC